MKGILTILIAAAGSLGAASLAAAAFHEHARQEPVYLARTVREGLTRDPAAWVGRTILVRGYVGGCILELDTISWPCRPHPGRNAPPADTLVALPLVPDHAGGALSVARRIPLLGGVLPGPQALYWGSARTYRVRLLAGAFPFCGSGICYGALLLDAAP